MLIFTSYLYQTGVSALYWAARNGHCHTVRLLLDRGADVNIADEYGETALHWAAIHGHLDIVKMLIEHGADINWLNLV